MIIEPAVDTEAAAVVELLLAQLGEHVIDTPRAGVEHAVLGMLADPRRGVILVARDAGTLVGVAWVSFTWALEHAGLTAWLEELYVVPARREAGIGGALVGEVCARARAAGCAAVDLEIDVEHARAANLYKRRGFQPLPRARWVKRLDNG